MIGEFGGRWGLIDGVARSIESEARKTESSGHWQEVLEPGEVSLILESCGLARVFALYCGFRHDGKSECGPEVSLSVYLSLDAVPIRGILRVTARAVQGPSFTFAELGGRIETCEPFHPGCRGATGAGASGGDSIHKPDLVTVIRYPLSQSQAYQKFIAERWYDPDVPPLDRLECPLDRAVFEWYESQVSGHDRAVTQAAGPLVGDRD